MITLPRSHTFWFTAFIIWWALLWYLSSQPHEPKEAPPIPHLDKIAHFGYFFGGAGLLSAALFRWKNTQVNWQVLTLIVVSVLTLTGMIDEYHQSFTPLRQGNDKWDLLADSFGALVGTQVFRAFSKLLS